MTALKSLNLLLLPLFLLAAGCTGLGQSITKKSQGVQKTEQIVGSVNYGPEPLTIKLSNPPVCCGGAQTGEGASNVKIYLADSTEEGAQFQIILGLNDQAVVFSMVNGASKEELFRSSSLPRSPEGDVVIEIPTGVLPTAPLIMWRAHAVPTTVQGVKLENPSGETRPILTVTTSKASETNKAPSEADERSEANSQSEEKSTEAAPKSSEGVDLK
jgi:hypothetical protein